MHRLDMIDPGPGGWNAPGWDRWAPWGFSLLVLVVGLWIWEVFPPGIWHDDGVYVLLSRSLAQGDGLRYVGLPGSPLAPKFPPVFPLLLAPIWFVAPDFPENAGLLGGVNLLVLSAAGGLFLAYLRRGLGLPLPLAGTIAVLAWISPALWRVALVPLSEPLFLLTLVATLWAGVRMERDGGLWGPIVFLVLGGLCFLTRSIGVAALAGGVGGLLLRKRVRSGLGVALGTGLVVLPWMMWSRWAASFLPLSLRDILGPYGGWLTEEIVRDPLAYARYLGQNGSHLLASVLSLLLPGVTGHLLWVGLLLVPVLLLGLREAGRKSPTLPLTLALTLGILLAWPFQDVRLLVPFQPILILAVCLGSWRLLGNPRSGSLGRLSGILTGGSWALLVLLISAFRLGTGWPAEPYRIRAEALVGAVRAVEEKTPAEAVVGAPELWSGIQLFTGRTVSPSARFLPLAGEGPSFGSPEAQYRLWMDAGITHILVEHGGRVHGEALDRIDAECAPGTVVLLDLQPGQFLVALNWDQECRARLLPPGEEGGA